MDLKEIRRIAQHTFASQQSDEESWYRSAVSFHEGSNVLGQHRDSIRGGMRVFLVNAAQSIELLLKVIIVAGGGKAPKTHELRRLGLNAGVAFSNNQEATLEWLSEIVKWSGRYPVPNSEQAWNHYYDDVHERLVVRERNRNAGITRANPETFPSIKNYEKLWDLADRKWGEIQINKQQTRIGTTTADPSLRSG
jgi:HEPN domain-containing protein